ncbi:MAG: hypothetical protein RIC35_24065 [Marinoscillum sp.]
MKNQINVIKPQVHYLGVEPFSERLIRALFARKSMKISQSELENAKPSDRLLLLDSRSQIEEFSNLSGFKVLLKNNPIWSSKYHLWCKTPINENSVDNILFYFKRWREEPFVKVEVKPVTVGLLENFIGNDDVQVKDVISEFVDNTTTNLRLIMESIESKRLEDAGEIAHRMLSSVSYYEVEAIRKNLKILENIAEYRVLNLNETVEIIEDQISTLRSGLVAKYF